MSSIDVSQSDGDSRAVRGSRFSSPAESLLRISVPPGTPILAAAAGRVSLVQGTAASGGYGEFTCIQHTRALSTCYAHQQRIQVAAGQFVDRGQAIGTTGCTGRCFGAHLHFEVRLEDRPTCPALYLGASPSSMCAA